MKHLRTLLASITAACLMGCGPIVTQSPGQGLSPVNAVSEGEDKHLMLFGYDVVSYFTKNRQQKGDPSIKSVYKGVTFRFAIAEHKRMFDTAPETYIPQFGGYCTNGIVYGVPWGGDADTWAIIDGKLYIFGGEHAKDAFLLHPIANLALANKYWSQEVHGANAFWQRSKRMVLRVPHWKTSGELVAEVAAAKAAPTLSR